MSELTTLEVEEYKKCNQIIKNTRGSFVACGNALATVRDHKLYRHKYSTFEQYCEKEWGWKRAHAYRLIEAANYVVALPENVSHGRQSVSKSNTSPKTEREARASIKADKSKTNKDEVIDLDKTGYPIPPLAMEYWNRATEVEEILSNISKARSVVKDLQDTSDLLYAEVNMNSVYADLNNAYHTLKLAVPYAVCSVCQGQAPKTCAFCKGRGVISKFRWERTVPEEIKEIRAKSSKAA